MKSFNVINFNINAQKFEPYDVIPPLYDMCKEELKGKKKLSHEEFKEIVKRKSMYQFWSRCEYEIILKDWPCFKVEHKIDVYQQIMMNIDIITDILMEELKLK